MTEILASSRPENEQFPRYSAIEQEIAQLLVQASQFVARSPVKESIHEHNPDEELLAEDEEAALFPVSLSAHSARSRSTTIAPRRAMKSPALSFYDPIPADDDLSPILSVQDDVQLKAHPETTYVHLLSALVPALRDEDPDEVSVRGFFEKCLHARLLCPAIQRAFYRIVNELDRADSPQRKRIIQVNRTTSKRDEEFFNVHFRRMLPLIRSRGMRMLIEVIYWSLIILSVKQYRADGFKPLALDVFEADYHTHLKDVTMASKAILFRYCNHMRAANKVLPTYYKQKFRHSCGEVLDMTGMRRTLGGAPSKITALMMVISKREGVLNR